MVRLTPGLALAVLMVSTVYANDLVDYENPSRTSAEDEIKSLPYLNEVISFRQYSGYLSADLAGKQFLHYWFVEAAEDPANKPILLWLNGGPGCSSMEGLFSELGPFELNNEATEVKLRKYSWNKLANVIFLESPAGVGYSYTKSIIYLPTDDSTAAGNYHAMKSFYEKFPQYKNNPLFLSGESYAGVYLPTLGVLIDADKTFNLKGIAIGNGYLDGHKLLDSLTYFLYYHGLFGKSFWDKFSNKCCGGLPPARENCNLDSVDLFCLVGISQEVDRVSTLRGLNPYNMYGDCPSSNFSRSAASDKPRLTRYAMDFALRKMNLNRMATNDTKKPFETINLVGQDLIEAAEPPCFDGDGMIRYLNDASVREAIHIPKKLGPWDACRDLIYHVQYSIRPGGLAPQMNQLINSSRNLTLLVFNGDTDLICNALGNEWFVDELGRKVVADYMPWKVNNQVAGWAKHYDGITFATVRGAGHMVPEFRPKEAFEMIKIFLSSSHPNVLL